MHRKINAAVQQGLVCFKRSLDVHDPSDQEVKDPVISLT